MAAVAVAETNDYAERIQQLEYENQKLRDEIEGLKRKLNTTCNCSSAAANRSISPIFPLQNTQLEHQPATSNDHPEEDSKGRKSAAPVTLTLPEYPRYSRQMLVPCIGLPGQLELKRSRILIIGAGGLGCPAAAYLSGAGIGTLGICDGDTVEVSNLHRQIGHSTNRVGMKKVHSLIAYCREINPNVRYLPYEEHLTPKNAVRILEGYDLVLDCTDHPSTRYLISDCCVHLGRPLVSASALRTSGQLLVLNNPVSVGPCYRCIWPRPAPAESLTSCSEGGVLGPVVGMMGVLMAMDAVKIITGNWKSAGGGSGDGDGRMLTEMLIYDCLVSPMLRTIKIKGRRECCGGCGKEGRENVRRRLRGFNETEGGDGDMDRDGMEKYISFCGTKVVDRVSEEEKINVLDFRESIKGITRNGNVSHDKDHMLLASPHRKPLIIDVREEVEYGICRLRGEGIINIPITTFERDLQIHSHNSKKSVSSQEQQGSTPPEVQLPHWLPSDQNTPIYILCKQGNDSQRAVKKLKEYLSVISPLSKSSSPSPSLSSTASSLTVSTNTASDENKVGENKPWKGGIFDVKGGLKEWRRLVDTEFPEY